MSTRALSTDIFSRDLAVTASCGGPHCTTATGCARLRLGLQPGRSYRSAPGAAPPVPACTSSDFSMYSCATRTARLSDCAQDA